MPFLSALRLVAAFQMIQGHSIDAVLAPSERAGPIYASWTYARGLTSVAFLVAAGLSMAVLTTDPARFERGRASRVRRALGLIALGYALHAPWSSLLGQPLGPQLLAATQVDVLQCIGASLLLLEASEWLARRAARFDRAGGNAAMSAWLALVAGCGALLAPTARGVSAVLPLPLAQYLTSEQGSLFPLLPWSGYLLTAFALGKWALPAGTRSDLGAANVRLLAATAGVMSLAVLLSGAGGPESAVVAFRWTKLGLVLAVALLLAWALRGVRELPAWLETLSSSTLLLYVTHILVLYGDEIGVQHHFGGSASAPWAVVFAAWMLVSTAACALCYRAFARARARAVRGAPAGVAAVRPRG